MSYSGVFKPKNFRKYKGDPTNIIYRSLWELRLMNYLDAHEDVLEWASEELFIPYKSPIDGKWHRYFPDFWVKQRDASGKIKIKLIEVKPASQSAPPLKRTKLTRRYINEVKTWGINQAKWTAAQQACQEKGWEFVVMTEKELGIK
jgi:hypothetical protein